MIEKYKTHGEKYTCNKFKFQAHIDAVGFNSENGELIFFQ